MSKNPLDIGLDDFDFGFSTVSEIEMTTQVAKNVDDKAQRVYKMIMPLLMNLKKDADTNEYIYWPDRAKKIDEFMAKLKKVVES